MNLKKYNSRGQLLNYGLRISDILDPNAYVLGGLVELPKVILQPNGQWDEFLPVYEPQYNEFLTLTDAQFGVRSMRLR